MNRPIHHHDPEMGDWTLVTGTVSTQALDRVAEGVQLIPKFCSPMTAIFYDTADCNAAMEAFGEDMWDRYGGATKTDLSLLDFEMRFGTVVHIFDSLGFEAEEIIVSDF